MAEGKKSFIFYIDWKSTFDALPNDKAGELIKHIFSYVNDENPITNDVLINAVFQNIKNSLKRDLKKYEGVKEQKSNGGKLGNLKRYHLDLYEALQKGEIPSLDVALLVAKTRTTSHTDSMPSLPIASVAVNDNDNVNDYTTYNKAVIENYIKDLKNEQMFLEGIYRLYKIRNGTVSTLAQEFNEHLKIQNKGHKDLSSFKKHFNSWIRLRFQNNNLQEYQKNSKGEL